MAFADGTGLLNQVNLCVHIVPCIARYLLSPYLYTMNLENSKAQLRKGILELCILGIIDADREIYPSDIIARMKDAELIVVEGTLYPLLSRLMKGGLLDYSWVESKTGPPRKYYKLTETGRMYLQELRVTWQNLVESVSAITQTIQPNNHE